MSPFTRAQYIDAITNALSYLKSQVELNSAINKYSINIEAEDFYAGFLNVVFGLRLKNANHAEKNIASIDLYEECGSDDGQRVAVQVTSKNDAAKIKKTLESFSKYEYQKDYTRLIILMITTKKEYRTEFSFTGESKIEFEPKRDILDVKDLLNQINSITDTDHLRSIYEYLNKELPPAILSLDGKGDTNRDRSNDNELFSRLMIIFSNDRKIHPSIRMMDPDPNLFPKGLPEIKSDNRLAVVDQKSPRAIKNMILDSWKRDDKRHILLVGEGGIGKTVAMLVLPEEEWFRQYRIPVIYVPLQRLDTYEGRLNSYLRDKFGADYDWIIELANRNPEGHPRLLLLLDGFNEIPDKFKQTAERFIREWMGRASVQIITTSRLGFSLENSFQTYKLQSLPKETVRSFLLSAGMREVHLPKENDRIWDVVKVPLMLTLYTQIDKVKEIADRSSVASLLDWREADNAAHIIWNYLQTELYRCIDKAGMSYSPMQYVTAILLVAPYVCCQMSYKMKFYINQEELQGLIREALSFYDERRNIVSRQFMNLRKKYDRFSRENVFQPDLADDYAQILVDSIALFQELESCDEKGDLTYTYSLMHQNFRDASAAFFISLCLTKASDSSEKTLLLEYADHYVKDYIAEFLYDEELIGVWNLHRKEEPEDGRITWILMDIIGRQRNYDYREVDFSGLDLMKTNIHWLLSRRQDICPLPVNKNKLVHTKVALKSLLPHGHLRGVRCVAYSPDGRHIASGSEDCTVRICDLESGESRVLEGHTESVVSIVYSPDGRHIASGSEDCTVRIWDVESGESRVLEGHTDRVISVVYSPDGIHVASGSEDRTVRIWDLESGESQVLKGHAGWVRSVAYRPDGRQLASGSEDHTVRIWNLENGESCVLEGHTKWVRCVAYNPDGRCLASGADDCMVRIWDLDSRKSRVLEGHTESVASLAYSFDGRYLASGSEDRTVRIWDIENEESRVLEGHSGWVVSVAYSPDGRHLASGSEDRTVRIWDIENGEESRVLEGYAMGVRSVAYSPDGRHLASGSEDRTVRVWNLDSGEYRVLEGHSGWVRSVAYSPDGMHLASASYDRTVRIWNLESGESCVLEGHVGWAVSVAYSPDGRHLASGSYDGTVRIWDSESGKGCVLEGHVYGVRSVAYSPDGKYIASGSDDRTVRIWNLESGESHVLEGHSNWVSSVAYSPDGKYLASGSYDSTVRIWDVESGESRVLLGHEGVIRSIAYSPDGMHIASGSDDRTVRIWDLESGESRVLDSLADWGRSVAYSPDGRYLASSASDSTIQIWDLENNKGIVKYSIIPHINLTRANFELADISEEDKTILNGAGAKVKGALNN